MNKLWGSTKKVNNESDEEIIKFNGMKVLFFSLPLSFLSCLIGSLVSPLLSPSVVLSAVTKSTTFPRLLWWKVFQILVYN